MHKKLKFLTSNRFWAVVLNAVILYLQQKGWIGTAELSLVTAIVAPFVVIATADKVAEKIGK